MYRKTLSQQKHNVSNTMNVKVKLLITNQNLFGNKKNENILETPSWHPKQTQQENF